ncbi:MAG: protein kinase [Elusimicrobia bacterium]|nr:protein kinase [Elusimicrobiota bacterium]
MRVLAQVMLLLVLAQCVGAVPLKLSKEDREKIIQDVRREARLDDSKYDEVWSVHYRQAIVAVMTQMAALPPGTDEKEVQAVWQTSLTELKATLAQAAAANAPGNDGTTPPKDAPPVVDPKDVPPEMRVLRGLSSILKNKGIQVGVGPVDNSVPVAPFGIPVGVSPQSSPQFPSHHTPQGPSLAGTLVDNTNRFLTSNYPGDPYGWIASAQSDMQKGDYRSAFRNYARALQLNRKAPTALFGYGSAAMNLGDTRLAAQSAEMALQLDPAHKGALTLLKLSEGRSPTVTLPNVLDANAKGGAFAMAPNAGSAAAPEFSGMQTMTAAEIAAELQRQAAAPPSAVQQSAAVTAQAMAALSVRDYTKAKELLTQAVALNGRNAEAYNGRAIAENKLGEYSDAINDASLALGLVPGDDTALQTRSWAFAQSGRYQEALADANYSLERDPANSFAYYNRAFALAGLRDREGAVESLKKASQIDQRFKPTYEEALQAPKDSDLLFLFADVGVKKGGAASAPEPGGRNQRFARLLLVVIMGGGLVGLGMLHVFSPRWRQTVYGTIRRIAGGTAPDEETAGADGFWNGYTVLREIAAGGMGVVYEATDNALNRRVAIKKMRDEIRSDPEERRRFLIEARTVATLHHPNIVDIYSIVEDGGDVYLVFEYVDGQTLCDFLDRSGPLALADAKRVMKEACAAVDYAHAQGVIHRDLKPANIMLASNGQVKVMDFGVARQAAEALTKAAQTNTIVGTPPYMAPEQEQGTVRRESDVFALGACFYEMVSNQLPFAGQGAGMLLNKVNGRHIPLSTVAPNLPASTDEVVARALAPDPEKRYRSAGELAAALQALPG